MAKYSMTRMQIIRPTVSLREISGQIGRRDSQLYYGEIFDVLNIEQERAYGKNCADGYEGWLALDALSSYLTVPNHRVIAQSAFVYPEPDVKTYALMQLPFGAYVNIIEGEAENGYVKIQLQNRTGWIWHTVVLPLSKIHSDYVAVAEQLLGVPYLWSGRSGLGIDCSGLVQLALSFCSISYPRDTFQQAPLGIDIHRDDLQRGDLLFTKGHVAIAVDKATVLHANEEIDSRVAYGSLEKVDAAYAFSSIKRPQMLAAA